MQEPLSRVATKTLSALLRLFPVVVVNGPRRTGKSTLVRRLAETSAWPYRSLDELTHRLAAAAQPEEFAAASIPSVLDEVQRVPELLLAVKAVVDRDLPPAPGQFVLTGSVDLLRDPRLEESLAGRAGYLRLGPMTRRELHGVPACGDWSFFFDHPPREWTAVLGSGSAAPREPWREVASRGGLPQIALATSGDDRARLLDAYVATYLERDLRDLAQIDQLPDFRRLMRAAALRAGNLLNVTELGRDIGVPAATCARWLRLLEMSFIIHRLEAFTANRTSRLLKSAKLYWTDPALAIFLADVPEPSGAHLENVVLADLLVWRELNAPRPSIMHWRAASGREVDFVVEHRGRVLGIEVKATTRPSPRDWKHLLAFTTEYADVAAGAVLLHDGDELRLLTEKVLIAPWWMVM